MKYYDLYGNEMEIENGNLIIDAEDPKIVEKLLKMPAVERLTDEKCCSNTTIEVYGIGNKVKTYPRSGLKALIRDDEIIATCRDIKPIMRTHNPNNFRQTGIIYCDLYGKEKCFLSYTITPEGMTYDFSRYCILKRLDTIYSKIILIPVKEENKVTRRKTK